MVARDLREPAAARDGGYHLPGVYAATLMRVCEDECKDELGPYAALADDWRGYLRDHDEAMAKAAKLFEERLRAGQPVTVMSWQLGNHDVRLPRGVFPGYRGSFKVTPDDVVTPSGRKPDGA
jgi:hypothetical protein